MFSVWGPAIPHLLLNISILLELQLAIDFISLKIINRPKVFEKYLAY